MAHLFNPTSDLHDTNTRLSEEDIEFIDGWLRLNSDTDLYELYNSNGNGPPDCNSQHAPIDVSHIADSSTLKQIREVKEVDVSEMYTSANPSSARQNIITDHTCDLSNLCLQSHQTYDKVLLEEFIPSAQCMVDSKKPEDGHKKVQQVDKHLCIDHFPCNAGWNNGTAELLFTTLSSFGKLRLYIGYWPVFTAEIHIPSRPACNTSVTYTGRKNHTGVPFQDAIKLLCNLTVSATTCLNHMLRRCNKAFATVRGLAQHASVARHTMADIKALHSA
ncbi:hypothetical protein C8T65DRAFT_702004 [Cerioporus squamosus]|nr:hypothetical protein C8T65DRAFT_702004 [Cerioporus squamosus]